MSNGKLNIIVALPCEARWFLNHYNLSRVNAKTTYSIYRNKESNIHLIVSGVGKVKSAAALSYLHASTHSDPNTCYLNAGIAGAANHGMGELFLAHKITDASSARNFYPLPILIEQIRSSHVVTVERATQTYPLEALVEMEAAGFHQAALALVTQEQIQTLKIISDNALNPAANIQAEQVVELFQQQSDSLKKIITYLLKLSSEEIINNAEPKYFESLTAHLHFTQYQCHQLKTQLRKWQIYFPEESPLTILAGVKTAQSVLHELEKRFDSVKFNLCK